VKSDPPSFDTVVPAEFITYTASLTSTGTAPLTDVRLDANLSDGIDYIPGSGIPAPSTVDTNFQSRSVNASTLTWEIGTMTQNQRFDAQFRVRVDQDAGTQVSVQFAVVSDQFDLTSNPLVHVIVPTALEEGAEPQGNQRLYLPLVVQ